MVTDVSGLLRFLRDFAESTSTFDVFFDVFSRRFPLPDVLRPDFCFGRGLLSDLCPSDTVSGADVTAPGGPRARRARPRVRRVPAAQPLRAVL